MSNNLFFSLFFSLNMSSNSSTSCSSSILNVQKDDLTKENIEKIFADCDKSGSGFINIKKLKIVMRALGLEPRQEEVNKLMTQMFEDSIARSVNQEAFTAQELSNLLSDRLKMDKIGDEIQTAFHLFDSDEKGFIDVEDLKRVTKELGEELNEDELKEMILIAECSTKGHITSNEFKNVMKKISLY